MSPEAEGGRGARRSRRAAEETTGDAFRVLVVCTGNVNRSALAAALLDGWSQWYLPAETAGAVRVASAGLRAPVGSTMGGRSLRIAEALGVDGSEHRAVQITDDAIRSADLVLVSSARQRDAVLSLVPGALRSTFTIREAGRIADHLDELPAAESPEDMRARVAMLAEHRSIAGGQNGDDDIVDPEGKEDAAFRTMARQEVPPLARLAGLLFGMPDVEITAYADAVEAGVYGFDDEQQPEAGAERRRGRRQA